ncbi:hypothetical protein ES703_107661 [subsurface metagenome]
MPYFCMMLGSEFTLALGLIEKIKGGRVLHYVFLNSLSFAISVIRIIAAMT